MYNVSIFTNGSCLNNGSINARGGWAAIVKWGDTEKVLSGSALGTKNNRMEMKAVIEAMKLLKKPCAITVMTPSRYVCTCAANIAELKQNGWRTKLGSVPKNLDLIKELDSVMTTHIVQFNHPNCSHNSYIRRCDILAREQASSLPSIQPDNEDLKMMALEEAIKELVARKMEDKHGSV